MATPARKRPAATDAARKTAPASSPADNAQPLFRREVMDEKRVQWIGPVLLEPSRGHRIFVNFALIAIIGFVLLLIFGTYTRKVRASGWLVPESGVARVYAPLPGVIADVQVREGVSVKKGAPLLTIVNDVRSDALIDAREEAVKQLRTRRDSIATSRTAQERILDDQKRDLLDRVKQFEAEMRFLTGEIDLQSQKATLSQDALARETAMHKEGLIPLARLQRAKQDALDQASRLQTLKRNRASLEREHAQAKAQLRELPMRADMQLGEIARSGASIEQELAEAETRRSAIVAAPSDGVVTGIQAERGGGVSANAHLLTIVPENSRMEAHLFSPSRGVGFLKPGQRVLLRVQSYAYQKFGLQEGTVVAISRAPASAAELPQPVSALASMISANEPLYRVTVQLKSQTVRAYGEAMSLKSGELVEADVLVDTRRLIEWVFEPLFAITGTLRS
jgi:membrane fusion protein